MAEGVQLDGLPELEARLAHAQAGVLDLTRDLETQLLDVSRPMVVFSSPHMRPRSWGAGELWQLPEGGWIGGKVQLPPVTEDQLLDQLQELLDGT